ncbi:CCR4-NOT transcription complex subunit 3 isoform X1 [Sabethes cyaneus]|uniref:CCR4-NOT transcription complex subunit 3 isoform X1 n=1 Tax=Sabethes cyaneus TaxID=53552 RepID=UPI00237D398A|nr:CCR4-NOT transcription complex subunit 3 isoform X1 [Sabethes cyaneus]
MAATRKLQGEIDRCLKKVTEGVETFEDIWQKVHNATNSNQKEKYEADLKKEIKKLQRLRDQIKSWIASGEIKDKSALLENRRLIETQMERFKVVERETKTKAYSKEGLGAAQKMDPAQREKEEISSWLTNSISSLQIQIDQFECEVESLIAGKKKKLDKDKQEKMDELKGKLERHKFHVTKLETLLRMLDNDGVEVEQIKKIKEDVEYYIDSSQEPDFEENEYIYDDIIGLDEVEISGIGTSAGTESNNSNETAGSPSSLMSGNSPSQSPVMNCSASTIHNHSVETIVDGNIDKRPKDVKITPVKPTAIRASVKLDINAPVAAVISNNTSINSSKSVLISSTPSKNLPNAAAVVAGLVPNSSGIVPPQAPAGGLVQPIIGPAFAAVAKQHPKNGPLHQSSVTSSSTVSSVSSAPAPTTVVPNASGAAVSNLSQIVNAAQPTLSQQLQQVQQQQQQQQQQASLASGLLTNAAAVVAAGVGGASGSNVQSQSQQQQPQQQQAPQVPGQNSIPLPHGGALTSASSGIENNHVMTTSSASTISSTGANIINNCVSPSNSAVSSRASPSLMSPPQQPLLNGPTSLGKNATSAVPMNIASTHPMSTLKTIAQEVINRTSGSLEPGQSPITGGALVQQQQQQQQQQPSQVTQQPPAVQQQPPPQPDTRQPSGGPPVQPGQQQPGNQQQSQPQPQPPQQQPQQQQPPFALVDPTNSANPLIPTSSSTAISNGPNAIINTSTNIVTNSANPSVTSVGGMKASGTNEAHIPPLLGVAPLGPSPLQKEHQIQFQMMEAAYYHLPSPSDSERLRTYLQRQPVQTPQHFPQQQLPHSDTVEFFQRLSPETLFFVFYYMEGTKAQYLAAKALKKQSWRFHTKYMMWFQRHEEPKIINEEFEQGTYIYFDYEKWGQRKKEGFTFEYKYLEDRDLN